MLKVFSSFINSVVLHTCKCMYLIYFQWTWSLGNGVIKPFVHHYYISNVSGRSHNSQDSTVVELEDNNEYDLKTKDTFRVCSVIICSQIFMFFITGNLFTWVSWTNKILWKHKFILFYFCVKLIPIE